MSRTRRRQSCRQKENPGWFKKGPDGRRSSHRLTREDRKKGWATTIARHPHLGLWLFIRIKQTCPGQGGKK